MRQHSPWIARDSALNRALDGCDKRGIGLVSMKQIRGHQELAEVPRRVPGLKAKGLTAYQGLPHAIWTDERISPSCASMRNTEQIREKSEAAELEPLRDACLAAGPRFCPDCDGRCARAAGTEAALGDLARLLSYHDQDVRGSEARRLFGRLTPAERHWSTADLEAARNACPTRLDISSILPRIARHLS